MDERKANIDLAFRNGLKDYEVLPPSDVWNSINGRLTRRRRPVYLLRAAAFLAIAVTMSLLAYLWTGNKAFMTDPGVMALNEESSSPLNRMNASPQFTKKKSVSQKARIVQTPVRDATEIYSAAPANISLPSSAMIIPETNLKLPLKTASLDNTIHHQSALTKTEKEILPIVNVTTDYRDYLVDENTSDKNSHWSIAALATPTYYGKFNTGSDELSQQLQASEQAVFSYSGGVALTYNLNKRFSIQSGLFYSSVGQDVNGINSFSGFNKYDNTKGDHNFEVLTTNGNVVTNNSDVFLFADGSSERLITSFNKDVFDPQKASLDYINNTMRQNFSYLELPVFLKYKFIDRTVDFNLIGGFSYNFLVNNSVYTVVDGNKYMIGTTEGINMFSLSSSLGMGMEYNISNKLSLNLEPTFRYYMNNFNNVAGSHFHPYSFGIFSGISYKF